MARDQGVPIQPDSYRLQGGTIHPSRGHRDHDATHARRGRPLPKLPRGFGSGKTLGAPQGGGPR